MVDENDGRTFAGTVPVSVIVPDSKHLEEVVVTSEKLPLIKVRANRGMQVRRGEMVRVNVFGENHPAHPDGSVSVSGDDVEIVAETPGVTAALQDGVLVKVGDASSRVKTVDAADDPLGPLGLSPAATKALKDVGLNTVPEVAAFAAKNDLTVIKGVARKSADRILAHLAKIETEDPEDE